MADRDKTTDIRETVGSLLADAQPDLGRRARSLKITAILAIVSELELERCLQVFLQRRFGVATLAELDDPAIPETFNFVMSVDRLARGGG